ncbi:MAG: hypothetical protein M3Q58_06160 [Bacteroidota bacterium]|nr:hypothetical protein [Bacteroidota bacterium]
MNNFKYVMLLTGLLLPQLFFSEYWLVLTLWIFTGYLLGNKFKYIFLVTFILQFSIGIVLFFLWSAKATQFLYDIPALFDLPAFIMPLFATLFNALNASFCLLAGTTISGLVKNRIIKSV